MKNVPNESQRAPTGGMYVSSEGHPRTEAIVGQAN